MAKMSRKDRLKGLMKRDGGRCGVHAFGCREIINEIGEEYDTDHIIPEAYFRFLPDWNKFDRQLWNKQPMHRTCNEKRASQVDGSIPYNCTCHHVYVDAKQDFYVAYRVYDGTYTEMWRKVKYFSFSDGYIPKREGREPLFVRGKASNFTISSGKDVLLNASIVSGSSFGNRVGYSGGRYGHIFRHAKPFERVIFNASEAFRCFRWAEVESQHQEFLNLLEEQGVDALVSEVDDEFLALATGYHLQRLTCDFFNRFDDGHVSMMSSILGGVERVVSDETPLIECLWGGEVTSDIRESLMLALMKYAQYLLNAEVVVIRDDNNDKHQELTEIVLALINQHTNR